MVRYVLDHINHDDLVGEPGGGGVGPWQNFIADPGWTTNTIRYRTVPGGLQFEGALLGQIGQGAFARIGVLPQAYAPSRQQAVMHAVITGISYAWGFAVFQITGEVMTWWSAAGTQMFISAIVTLD